MSYEAAGLTMDEFIDIFIDVAKAFGCLGPGGAGPQRFSIEEGAEALKDHEAPALRNAARVILSKTPRPPWRAMILARNILRGSAEGRAAIAWGGPSALETQW